MMNFAGVTKRVFQFLAIGALAGCVSVPVGRSAPPALELIQPPSPALVQSTRSSQTFLNAQRAKVGRGGLVASPYLMAAAQGHARDMSTNAYFSHSDRSGGTVGNRVRAQGYNYCWVGENIALGQKSEAEVMAGWMASKGHRKNNLHPRATQFGLARAPGNYWVLVLGTPGC